MVELAKAIEQVQAMAMLELEKEKPGLAMGTGPALEIAEQGSEQQES